MSEDWSGGSTRRWRKIRKQVLERDQYRCMMRIPGVCTIKATTAHHLLGKKHGDNPKDCVAACAPCNQHIGDPTGSDKDPAHHPHTPW